MIHKSETRFFKKTWLYHLLESGKFSKPTYVGVCGTLEPQDMGVGDVEMTQKLLKTPSHLNNPGECRSEWYSDQPDYQSGLQMPQLFEKIHLVS